MKKVVSWGNIKVFNGFERQEQLPWHIKLSRQVNFYNNLAFSSKYHFKKISKPFSKSKTFLRLADLEQPCFLNSDRHQLIVRIFFSPPALPKEEAPGVLYRCPHSQEAKRWIDYFDFRFYLCSRETNKESLEDSYTAFTPLRSTFSSVLKVIRIGASFTTATPGNSYPN